MSYKPPKPEFELDELVIGDVKEPKIEFFGNCKDCEIPLIEEHSEVGFCEECYKKYYVTSCGNSVEKFKN